MVFHSSPDDIVFLDNVNKNKRNLQSSFDKTFSQQEKTLEIFMLSIQHCDLNGFDKDRVIWNAAAFIQILSLDLKTLTSELLFAKGYWKQRLHGRTLCLIIHEALDDLFQLLGTDFKPTIKNLSICDSVELDLKEIRSDLNIFKSQNLSTLKNIRNVAIAHRDKNVKEQVDVVTNISVGQVFGYVSSFDKILNRLGGILKRVIDASIVELKK